MRGWEWEGGNVRGWGCGRLGVWEAGDVGGWGCERLGV